MKVGAHCSLIRSFDRKMVEAFKGCWNDVTMVPVMRNLWALIGNVIIAGGNATKAPTPDKCPQCGKTDKIRRKMVWIGKEKTTIHLILL